MKIKRTFGVQWHITEECDQKCKHCYSVAEQKDKIVKNELTKEQCVYVIDNILHFCKENGCIPGIALSGGDPLLCNHFWDIVEYLRKNEVPFSILGNPFHISPEICRELVALGCEGYQMSLDGLEHTHDSMWKEGSFQATLKAFDILKNAGIWTAAMNTITEQNYHELLDLIKVVVDFRVDSFAFARYSPTGISNSLSMIQPLEYRQLLKRVWNLYEELGNESTIFSLKDHLFKLLLWEEGLFEPNDQKIVIDGCGCGSCHCSILPDGTVYACRRFNSPVGNLLDSTLGEVFFGKKMAEYRCFNLMEGCKDCELLYDCRGCHAVSHGFYGSFFRKDPQCWRFV